MGRKLLSLPSRRNRISHNLSGTNNMVVTFQQQILIANRTRNQTITLAQGDANARLEMALGNIRMTEQSVSSEMYAFGNVTHTLGLSPSESIDYLWWDTFGELASKGTAGK